MSPKDRPPLEAILAFEVGQIVELVFGALSSGTGCSRKRGLAAIRLWISAKYSSTSLATLSSPPGSSARAI